MPGGEWDPTRAKEQDAPGRLLGQPCCCLWDMFSIVVTDNTPNEDDVTIG